MDRRELIKELIFWSMSDDFENIDQIILPTVSREASELGIAVTRADIVEALTQLVKDGMAKAYMLGPGTINAFSGELSGRPEVVAVEEGFQTYFYVTKHGLDFYNARRTYGPGDE